MKQYVVATNENTARVVHDDDTTQHVDDCGPYAGHPFGAH